MATQDNYLGFCPHSEGRDKTEQSPELFFHRSQMRQREGSLSLLLNENRKRAADRSGEGMRQVGDVGKRS